MRRYLITFAVFLAGFSMTMIGTAMTAFGKTAAQWFSLTGQLDFSFGAGLEMAGAIVAGFAFVYAWHNGAKSEQG